MKLFSFLKKVPTITSNQEIELGATYTDRITDHTGVVTGVCVYISGCSQALLCAKQADGGVATWYDIQRLVRQDVPVIALDNGTTPGCGISAPVR